MAKVAKHGKLDRLLYVFDGLLGKCTCECSVTTFPVSVDVVVVNRMFSRRKP